MAGSLKIACDLGETTNVHTLATFGTLSGATAFTIAFFYQFEAVPASGTWSSFIEIGGVGLLLIEVQFGSLNITVKNGAGTKTLSKSIPLDTVGHHVAISGKQTGISTIYVDGISSATTIDLGSLVASSVPNTIRWDDTSRAGGFNLRDIAIWGTHAVGPAEAIDLATGAKTPTLLVPHADNYWSGQGTPGLATVGSAGLHDQYGSCDLDFIGGTGAVTYDALDIVATPVASALIGGSGATTTLMPYVDTTGYLLTVPIYLNPVNTAGGPLLGGPTVSTDPTMKPVFTVGGSTVVPAQLPTDSFCGMVVYQFATPVTTGQAVTMAATIGWASTPAGAVGGTSAAGLGSAPITCTNYAGTSSASPPLTPTFKIGQDIVSVGMVSQVMRNWARRMHSLDPGLPADNYWRGSGVITGFDANNMPTGFTGGTGTDLLNSLSSPGAYNGVDMRSIPAFLGTWTLIHGDGTSGVTSSSQQLQIDLVTLNPDWTVGPANVVHGGDWDGTAWHRIIKTYPITWSPSGGHLNPGLYVRIARTDNTSGAVGIPILANGQSELGIFEPDDDDPAIPATIPANYLDLFDPLAVSPSFLARHAGSHAIRWGSHNTLSTTTMGGDLVYPADLDARKSTDFLATNQIASIIDVSRIDPAGEPILVIADYINGNSTGKIPVSRGWYKTNGAYALVTTATPHGIRTRDRFTIANQPAVRAVVSDSAHITLTGPINASQTTIPVSAFENINGDAICNIGVNQIFQLGPLATDEQVEVSAPPTSTTIQVNRHARGTTALSKPSGTVVYPCMDTNFGGINDACLAVSPTQLLVILPHRAIPKNETLAHTLLYAQTYSSGTCPIFSTQRPNLVYTSSYELIGRANRLIAEANPDGRSICWVIIPFMATDAVIATVVNKMAADFHATPGMDLIVQCDNEVFNAGFDAHTHAVILTQGAPNPQTSGTGFADWYEYLASRQDRFTNLARDAFALAGLDPDRVVWFHQFGNLSATQEALAFCQTYSLPVRSLAVSWYADMGNSMASTYVSWLPASTGIAGAAASWDLATCRRVMMSQYQASIRHGVVGSITLNVFWTQYLSRYNNGISVNGTSPANTNRFPPLTGTPIRGRLCGYEGATTQPLPIPFPGDSFPECAAFTLALQYDPEWYWTEWEFFKANQGGSYPYALLMEDLFPNPDDAIMEFGCYFMAVGASAPMNSTQAYMYAVHRWQQQKAGRGLDNRLDFWTASGGVVTAVNHDMTANGGSLPPTINESVRGQAARDWIATVAGSPTPTPARRYWGQGIRRS